MAVRKEGKGIMLDSAHPHLIGIDDDIFSTGITMYNLKVWHGIYSNTNWHCKIIYRWTELNHDQRNEKSLYSWKLLTKISDKQIKKQPGLNNLFQMLQRNLYSMKISYVTFEERTFKLMYKMTAKTRFVGSFQ